MILITCVYNASVIPIPDRMHEHTEHIQYRLARCARDQLDLPEIVMFIVFVHGDIVTTQSRIFLLVTMYKNSVQLYCVPYFCPV